MVAGEAAAHTQDADLSSGELDLQAAPSLLSAAHMLADSTAAASRRVYLFSVCESECACLRGREGKRGGGEGDEGSECPS